MYVIARRQLPSFVLSLCSPSAPALLASDVHTASLLSVSGTPQIRERVAWPAARTACFSDPRPSLTRASALACSLEMRLVLSLWENTLSCASEAFLFRYVLCHASRASAQIASWAARRVQISLKALLVFQVPASCAAQQLENSLVTVAMSSHEQSSSSCRRSWSELVSHL